MASVKDYAYYMQGNKISLIEKEAAFDNDPNSKDYGPGTDRFQWKSPLADVTDGLEILYSYAPTYNIGLEGPVYLNINSAGAGVFSVFGWTVRGGYLTFILGGLENLALIDFSHSDYDEELGTAGEQYIVIEGSNRWSGSHKIKARGAQGWIQTNTKVYGYGYIEQTASFDFNDSSDTIDTDDTQGALNAAFREFSGGSFFITFTDYTHSVAAANNKRIYKGTFTSGSPDTINISGAMKYDYENHEWTEDTTTDSLDDATNAIYRMNVVYRDECTLFGKNASQTLQDESFTLDLPDYLSKAAVYYIKARYLEDQGQFKESEYLMAKFRKQVEKYSNSLIGGPRMIASGPHAIR